MNKTTKTWILAILTAILLTTTISATEIQKLQYEATIAVKQLQQEYAPPQTIIQQLNTLKNTTELYTAKELHHNILLKTNDALRSKAKLNIVNQLLQKGYNKKLKMQNTQTIFTLANNSFQREDFTTALNRATQAETTANVELKQIPWKYVLINYWWIILLIMTMFIITAKKTYPKIKTKIINARIHNLLAEEKNIIHLMTKAQEQHYQQHKTSTSQYHQTMYSHQHRLNKIRKQLDWLRTQRAAINGIEREQAFLKQEQKQTEELIKHTQQNYFIEQTISKTEYEQQIQELLERLASIEQRQTLLGAMTKKPTKMPMQQRIKKPRQTENIIEALKKTYNIDTRKRRNM